jgi:hypothetical protein
MARRAARPPAPAPIMQIVFIVEASTDNQAKPELALACNLKEQTDTRLSCLGINLKYLNIYLKKIIRSTRHSCQLQLLIRNSNERTDLDESCSLPHTIRLLRLQDP